MSALATTTNKPPTFKTYKILCDLDGVLVDFESGCNTLFNGRSIPSISKNQLWRGISQHGDFYNSLPWMADGKELWSHIRPLQPDILTGLPMGGWATSQKVRWCQRELGCIINHVDMSGKGMKHSNVNGGIRRKDEGVINLITCWSKNKHVESCEGMILIDDRADLGIDWSNAGGTFVHHVNTRETLKVLRGLGVLPEVDVKVGEDKVITGEYLDGMDLPPPVDDEEDCYEEGGDGIVVETTG